MLKIIANKEHNGLELYFESKPEQKVIDCLKSAFFRWHNLKKCWFAKNTEKNQRLIKSLLPDAEISNKTMFSLPVKVQAKLNKYGVKVGDIFYISWGYDQTNVNFFQVVELVGNVSIRIKEICDKHVRSNYSMSSYVSPVKDKFIDGIFIKDRTNGDLKKIQLSSRDDGSVYIKVSSYYAHLTTETATHFTSSWA